MEHKIIPQPPCDRLDHVITKFLERCGDDISYREGVAVTEAANAVTALVFDYEQDIIRRMTRINEIEDGLRKASKGLATEINRMPENDLRKSLDDVFQTINDALIPVIVE